MNGLVRATATAPRLQGWLGVIVVAGLVALAWSGYRAATEWQGSSALLVERRARDLADLLATALTRDMRGVQEKVLAGSEFVTGSFEPPSPVTEIVATAFARYPYPEVFFGWYENSDAPTVFYTRADRPPAWKQRAAEEGHYPVETTTYEPLQRTLRARTRRDASAQRQYAAFDTVVGGERYQVVARLVYAEETREHLASVFGFMVNARWVRAQYFTEIAQQASRVGASADGLEYLITDERGDRVAGTDRMTRPAAAVTREFPAIFLDPSLVALDPPRDLARPTWAIHVSGASDRTFELAAQGARRTLVAVASAALLAGLGFVAAIRAGHASAKVAAMRSDFVSAVTHELKTPLSTIRTIAETLVRGRLSSPEQVHQYAELLAQEERRLARLIDNLLAYSRVTDVTEVYSFESLAPYALVDEAVSRFKHQLSSGSFDVTIDVDQALPRVRADRSALVLALDNVIDNAIRYSGTAKALMLVARAVGSTVEFSVTDAGVGIPADDLERVQRRFSRGRAGLGQGSGLGLAIVRRIVDDHGGRLHIESTEGRGTTVRLTVPLAVE